MQAIDPQLKQPLIELLLSVADDKFILGHHNADWTGLAPILEEDIAFSSLAQDEIAHAAALYELTGQLTGRDPNQLAYGRRPDEYRCAAIVELYDDFDWAMAVARQFFCDHFDLLRLRRLAQSSWEPLSALASRQAAEERIHVDHCDSWILRLGRGGDEARQRIQAAVDRLAPLASGLFEPTQGLDVLERAGLYPLPDDNMFEGWAAALENIADQVGLRLKLPHPDPQAIGGRRGRHTPQFAQLLDELTAVYRLEPQAAW